MSEIWKQTKKNQHKLRISACANSLQGGYFPDLFSQAEQEFFSVKCTGKYWPYGVTHKKMFLSTDRQGTKSSSLFCLNSQKHKADTCPDQNELIGIWFLLLDAPC